MKIFKNKKNILLNTLFNFQRKVGNGVYCFFLVLCRCTKCYWKTKERTSSFSDCQRSACQS